MHATVTAILCVSVFTTTGVGLNNGMVICVDDHGHVAVEAAHVQHAHRHADGEHHGDDGLGLGLDPDHEALHDAIASCFDSHMGPARQHSPRLHALRLGRPTFAVPFVIAGAATTPPTAFTIWETCNLRGAAARAELACLSAIVLLV